MKLKKSVNNLIVFTSGALTAYVLFKNENKIIECKTQLKQKIRAKLNKAKRAKRKAKKELTK